MTGVFVSLSASSSSSFSQKVLDVPVNYILKKQHKISESMGREF
jgi:hypothetical protein